MNVAVCVHTLPLAVEIIGDITSSTSTKPSADALVCQQACCERRLGRADVQIHSGMTYESELRMIHTLNILQFNAICTLVLGSV